MYFKKVFLYKVLGIYYNTSFVVSFALAALFLSRGDRRKISVMLLSTLT